MLVHQNPLGRALGVTPPDDFGTWTLTATNPEEAQMLAMLMSALKLRFGPFEMSVIPTGPAPETRPRGPREDPVPPST